METSYLKTMARQSRDYRIALALAISLPLLAAAGGIAAICLEGYIMHPYTTCTIKVLTGLNCLSCGATRATYALLRGDIITAIYYNPFYILCLGWLCYLYARLIISLVKKPYVKYCLTLKPWHGFVVIAIALVFLVVRNTSFYQAFLY